MKFCLDTNTLIYFFKGLGNVSTRLLTTPPGEIAIPTVVLFELEVGIGKSAFPRKRKAQFQELASLVSIISFGPSEAKCAAGIRIKLERQGNPIGPYDILIAASAMANNSILVTHNQKEFERVGGHRTLKTDVRIIAATNKNLERAVEEETFRGDLYYRLNVFPIYMPPLRERKTDILLLADYFLEKYAGENHKDIKRFSTPAIDMLMEYHWPGNVRELENCIERAVLLCEEGVIHSYHLPPTLQTGKESDTVPSLSLEDAVASLEKEMIIDALKNTGGNVTMATQTLQTTVRKFAYKAQKYGVDYRQYR